MNGLKSPTSLLCGHNELGLPPKTIPPTFLSLPGYLHHLAVCQSFLWFVLIPLLCILHSRTIHLGHLQKQFFFAWNELADNLSPNNSSPFRQGAAGAPTGRSRTTLVGETPKGLLARDVGLDESACPLPL